MNYYIDTEFLEGVQKEKFPTNLFRKETPPTIELISIGIVAEDIREYYAISKEFNLKEAWDRYDEKVNTNYKPDFGDYHESHYNPKFIREYWIRDNVLKPIYKELHNKENLTARQAFHRCNIYIPETEFKFTYNNFKKLINKYGKTNKQIAEEIKEFCLPKNNLIWSGKNSSYIVVQDRDKHLKNDIIAPEMLKRDYYKPQFHAYYADYDWVAFCWLFGKMIDLPNGFPMYCIDLKQELDRKVKESGGEFSARLHNIKMMKNYPRQTNEHNALADARWNKEFHDFINKL